MVKSKKKTKKKESWVQQVRRFALALGLIVAGVAVPWSVIPEYGSYVQAGLTVGGVFYLLKLLDKW